MTKLQIEQALFAQSLTCFTGSFLSFFLTKTLGSAFSCNNFEIIIQNRISTYLGMSNWNILKEEEKRYLDPETFLTKISLIG